MVELGDSLKVSRDDMKGFPGDTIDLVLNMQKAGWRASRSNRSHIMLLAPDGVTRKSASKNPDSAKYLAEDLRKYNKAHGIGVESEKIIKVKTVTEKFVCPKENCPKSFITEEKAEIHYRVDHLNWLKCPDCDRTFIKPAGLGLHRANKHGYVSPTKGERDQKKRVKLLDKVQVPLSMPEEEFPPYSVDKEGPVFLVDKKENFVYTNEPPVLGDEKELWEKAQPNLASAVSYGDNDITFIDERDSWVFDFSDVMDRRVGTLQQILNAAGLQMEIRVWRETND